VVSDLESAGLPYAEISIVSSNADNWYKGKKAATTGKIDRDASGVDDRVEGAETGASVGAVVGGGAGLLAGLGLMAIPGIGPVVAAGWLVATAAGECRRCDWRDNWRPYADSISKKMLKFMPKEFVAVER
jgi:hypothetical protein